MEFSAIENQTNMTGLAYSQAIPGRMNECLLLILASLSPIRYVGNLNKAELFAPSGSLKISYNPSSVL